MSKVSEKVTRTENFAGTIVDSPIGKKLIVKSKEWYKHQINKFRVGENVTLVVHSERPKRSEQQNKFYWGVYLPKVAEETGEKDLDRLHELFKGKFLTEGVVEVLGEKVRMKKSTTELSKSEFTEYIMAIENHTNVKAPPTENWDIQ